MVGYPLTHPSNFVYTFCVPLTMETIRDVGQGSSTNNEEGPFVSRDSHWALKEATRQGLQRMETNIEERYEDLRNDSKELDKRINMLNNDLTERMNVMRSNLTGQMEAIMREIRRSNSSRSSRSRVHRQQEPLNTHGRRQATSSTASSASRHTPPHVEPQVQVHQQVEPQARSSRRNSTPSAHNSSSSQWVPSPRHAATSSYDGDSSSRGHSRRHEAHQPHVR